MRHIATGKDCTTARFTSGARSKQSDRGSLPGEHPASGARAWWYRICSVAATTTAAKAPGGRKRSIFEPEEDHGTASTIAKQRRKEYRPETERQTAARRHGESVAFEAQASAAKPGCGRRAAGFQRRRGAACWNWPRRRQPLAQRQPGRPPRRAGHAAPRFGGKRPGRRGNAGRARR
jgi:hypothetical protein